jgi:hypothetical protein
VKELFLKSNLEVTKIERVKRTIKVKAGAIKRFLEGKKINAGQLIKGLSGYVFEGGKLQSNDNTIKSSFSLIKTALDAEECDRRNGRIGGLKVAEKSKKRGGILVITETKEQSCPTLKILQDMLSDTAENLTKSEDKSIAKD